MHHGTGGDDLSYQLHVLDCESSLEAVDPLLKDPKSLLNQKVGLTECLVVALVVRLVIRLRGIKIPALLWSVPSFAKSLVAGDPLVF